MGIWCSGRDDSAASYGHIDWLCTLIPLCQQLQIFAMKAPSVIHHSLSVRLLVNLQSEQQDANYYLLLATSTWTVQHDYIH